MMSQKEQIQRLPVGNQRRKLHPVTWSWHAIFITGVMFAAWHYIDFSELKNAFLRATPQMLVLLLGLATLDRFLMALKWWQLLRAGKIQVPFWLVLSAYYQAAFVGRVLPSALSGDILRGYILTRQSNAWQSVLSTMVLEKAIAIVASATLATLGSSMLWGELRLAGYEFILLAAPAAFIFSITALYASFSEKIVTRLTALVPWQKPKRYLSKLHDAYNLFAAEYRTLILNFCLAIIENALQVIFLYACALAIGVNIDMWLMLAVLSLSQLLRKFAIVIEGWVFGEFINVLTCTLVGISPTEALALSLLGAATGLAATIPGGFLLMLAGKGRVREIEES